MTPSKAAVAFARDLRKSLVGNGRAKLEDLPAIEELFDRHARSAEVVEALKPLAAVARIYDDRVYPPDKDSQLISVCLGDLRKARALLATLSNED